MAMIEPNIIALVWFAMFALVASVGFYVLAGAFPLETRPDLQGALGRSLAFTNVLLLAVLVIGSLIYGAAHLRWTSVVIAGASAFLFAPGLFDLWPERWRDGRVGLAIVLAGFGVTLVLLQTIGAVIH